MPCIKVTDIAYGRLRAPDLDVMEEFLTRFGMMRSERTATALYMRGTDPAHHIHVTEKGEPKFVGLCLLRARARTISNASPRRRARRRSRRSTSPAAASACG